MNSSTFILNYYYSGLGIGFLLFFISIYQRYRESNNYKVKLFGSEFNMFYYYIAALFLFWALFNPSFMLPAGLNGTYEIDKIVNHFLNLTNKIEPSDFTHKVVFLIAEGLKVSSDIILFLIIISGNILLVISPILLAAKLFHRTESVSESFLRFSLGFILLKVSINILGTVIASIYRIFPTKGNFTLEGFDSVTLIMIVYLAAIIASLYFFKVFIDRNIPIKKLKHPIN